MPTATRLAIGLLCLALGLGTRVALAALTPDQKAQLRTADAALKKCSSLYAAKKYSEAAETLGEVVAALEAAAEGAESKDLLPPTVSVRKRLAKARELLADKNVELPDLPRWIAAADKTGRSGVSFSRQIAPILVAKCGNCHVQQAKGGFSMATFAALAQGSKDGGAVIDPGKGESSRIVEAIESGDMPRGNGAKVSAAELALLTRWIDEGARYDAKNPAQPLPSLAPGAKAAPAAKPAPMPGEFVPAAGDEPVQFARDVGPVLLANCVGCHGERNPGGQFGMTTFTRFMLGGTDGAVVVPGKAANSLLVQKLRGTAPGERMPRGKDPLSEDVIAKIEQWIELGAKYDGSDAGMPLAEVVALVESRHATHEELTQRRAAAAARYWSLALPDTAPTTHETRNFLVYGNVGPETLAEVGAAAEVQAERLAKALKLPDGQPLVKGKLTWFVLDRFFDYSEIGQMVEKREIPAGARGHWRYTVVDAYACVVLPKNGEYELVPFLLEQLAAVHVAGLGTSPRWFAEGSGRALAARLEPKDARIRNWDKQVGAVLSTLDKPERFLAGDLPPEDTATLSYSFVRFLLAKPAAYQSLLAALAAGTKFEDAFARSFGGTPAQLVPTWAARGAGRRGR